MNDAGLDSFSLETDLTRGLSAAEVRSRLARFGPNEVPEPKAHPWRAFLKRFWGLTAWMLEGIIALSLGLGRYADAAIVAVLLAMNAVIGGLEERRAARSVDELRKRLRLSARVLRDGAWMSRPARDLVPGDVVRVRPGDLLPADLRIGRGAATADQSALTGESIPIETAVGDELLGGSLIRRGEATAVVLRTGLSTRFGRTVQLVQSARPKLHLEEVVAGLARRLLAIIGGLVALTLAVTLLRGQPVLEILPLLLVILLSAIPVALPVMFTVSMAVGARELASRDVLVTRLSAAEDAATMDILCLDKTGTLTLNEMALTRVVPQPPFSRADVLLYGALASQEANQDPLDRAFLEGLGAEDPRRRSFTRERFIPFSPQTRRTEAVVGDGRRTLRVMKGAVSAIAEACRLDGDARRELDRQAEAQAGGGDRTMAVALDEGAGPVLVGWVALGDGLRPDSKALIAELKSLGLAVKMLTGDAWPIARRIAGEAGIGDRIARMSDLKRLQNENPAAVRAAIEDSDGFAEVYPEDKFLIVRGLQSAGHVVGMTGDGVNDAPALKQAEVGIAVSGAADVAKASASVVLTGPGLGGIVDLVKNGRRVYQRIATWVLNKIQRTVLKSAFIVGVFLATGDFVVSAFAMVLLLLMTDFVKIALSTDRVRWSSRPETWLIGPLAAVAAVLGGAMALESLALLAMGSGAWGIPLADPRIRTLSLEILLFSALASIFIVRERRPFWRSAPSRTLALLIVADFLIGVLIGLRGIPGHLPPLPPALVGLTAGFSAVCALGPNDLLKVFLLRRFGRQAHFGGRG